MDILQYYYHGSQRDRDRITNICKFENMNVMSKGFSKMRERFNIQPKEIGFIEFPTKEDRKGIKINDWIIKSHTGIFDEKEENTDEEN